MPTCTRALRYHHNLCTCIFMRTAHQTYLYYLVSTYLHLDREEIVGTVFDHIEECKQLDQKRHGDSAFSSKPGVPKDPLITSLPDIDDGGFQLLRKNDQVIVSREEAGGSWGGKNERIENWRVEWLTSWVGRHARGRRRRSQWAEGDCQRNGQGTSYSSVLLLILLFLSSPIPPLSLFISDILDNRKRNNKESCWMTWIQRLIELTIN